MSKDSLGDRIKGQYEDRTRHYLPRRTYTIVRVDGRSFHAYCRNLERPFDRELMADMDQTAVALCAEMQGVQVAYVQSDEISVLLTDFGQPDSEAWFDGNLQKIVSISAATATAAFNACRIERARSGDLPLPARWATFDARAFTIPDPVEVENYFIWRQQDATRNSISMAAHAHFPHGRLQHASSDALQDLLFREKGINWNDYPVGCKRGRAVIRELSTEDVTYTDRRTNEVRVALNVTRSHWVAVDPPIFTQDRTWLQGRIPRHD